MFISSAPGVVNPVTSDKGSDKGLRIITRQELAKHNTPDDCWVQINDMVCVTDFTYACPKLLSKMNIEFEADQDCDS